MTDKQKMITEMDELAETHGFNRAHNSIHDMADNPSKLIAYGKYLQLMELINNTRQDTNSKEVVSVKMQHPESKEEKTVTFDIKYLKDIIETDPDRAYDALGEQFCNCQPVGETNVVECGCIDYLECFEIMSTDINTLPTTKSTEQSPDAVVTMPEEKQKAIMAAARDVIYFNDDVMGLIEIGSNKTPDNYRAEGWYQAYQALMRYAAALTNNADKE